MPYLSSIAQKASQKLGKTASREVASTAGKKAAQAAGELVRVGLWDVVPGGWAFHDWADYQPLAAEVEAQRVAWRDRQAKARSRRRGSG